MNSTDVDNRGTQRFRFRIGSLSKTGTTVTTFATPLRSAWNCRADFVFHSGEVL